MKNSHQAKYTIFLFYPIQTIMMTTMLMKINVIIAAKEMKILASFFFANEQMPEKAQSRQIPRYNILQQ